MTPVLDRIPFFDPRSRNFPVRPLLTAPTATPDLTRKRVWTPGPLLNQGQEGHCVGFGEAGELGATPVKVPVDDAFAHDLFFAARRIDRGEGRLYTDGATVIAGCKAAQELGLIRKYVWCFSIEDVILAILRHSPVVIGINWYESMYETDHRGMVTVGGSLVGGHCLYVNGWWPDHPEFSEDVFVWQNSWGTDYGVYGRGFIRREDLARLLAEDGEAVVFTDIRK